MRHSKSLKENKYIWYSFILKFILREMVNWVCSLIWVPESSHFSHVFRHFFHTFFFLHFFFFFNFLHFFVLFLSSHFRLLTFLCSNEKNKILQLKYRWHYYWIIQDHSTIYKIVQSNFATASFRQRKNVHYLTRVLVFSKNWIVQISRRDFKTCLFHW